MKLDITKPIYNDEDAARAHLEAQLWPNGPVCPHCGSLKATKLEGKAHRKGLYQCNEPECREQFSVTVNTVFERSKIPLHKWVLASHLMAASKKGMSSKQIQRMLGISYKSAWFMSMRLREAMDAKDYGPIGGDERIVEADEAFIGGRAKNVHKGKPVPKKKPVVALVERGGEVRAKHVPDVTGKNVRQVWVTQADRRSMLMTDDSVYAANYASEFYAHASVTHSRGEYTDEAGFAHTNTIESFFSILKRGITGSFHAVSEKHLQRYVDEFAFRWNTRSARGIEDFERADRIIKGAAGKRLTYRRTDEAKEREGDGA